MGVEVAKRCFELMDSADAGTDDVLELYGDNPVVHSSRAGVVSGLEEILQFHNDNAEFFTGGKHYTTQFHKAGNTVVCEGYPDGETAVGRDRRCTLCDVIEFDNNDQIVAFRAYLDYRGYINEVPEELSDIRAEAE
jgi:hypothetical protein